MDTYISSFPNGETMDNTINEKMTRVVLTLTKNGSTYTLKDKDNATVNFAALYDLIDDESNYVVILYDQSKLRPQYVSANEIHCGGEDFDSDGVFFLRMLMTPTSLSYQRLDLANETDTDEMREDINNLNKDLSDIAKGKSFTVATDTEHSSQLDRIKFSAQNGEKLYVTVVTTDDVYTATVFLYPTSETTGGINLASIPINRRTQIALTSDCEFIGIWLGRQSYARNITFIVERENSAQKAISDTAIKEYFRYTPEHQLEIGNITIGGFAPIYSANAKRVRLKEGTKIYLNAGDIIGLSDYTDARFYLGWEKNDGTYGYKNGWNTKDVVAEEAGYYYFTISNRTEVEQTSVNDLGELLFITHTAKPVEFPTVQKVIDISNDASELGIDKLRNYSFIPLVISSAAKGLIYDSVNDVFKIPRDTVILSDKIAGGYAVISTEQVIDTANVGSTALKILYDFANSTFSAVKYNTEHDGTKGIIAVLRRQYNGTGNISIVTAAPYLIDGYLYGIDGFASLQNLNVKSINHRGYNTIAPENTLPAFKLSKKYGFDYVETDISFTSDGVPVLLHDTTVDRTSDGTGNIADLTLEEVKALDFGSWKSEEYAGTQIPTLDEFISLCRNIGLHPYLELKTGESEQAIQSCCDIVRLHGMRDNVTWISYSNTLLGYVKDYEPNARLGLLADTVTSTTISTVNALKNDSNEVFIDGSTVSSEMITAMATAGIPLETWVGNTEAAILSKPDYNTGFTTDKFHAGTVLAKTYGN